MGHLHDRRLMRSYNYLQNHHDRLHLHDRLRNHQILQDQYCSYHSHQNHRLHDHDYFHCNCRPRGHYHNHHHGCHLWNLSLEWNNYRDPHCDHLLQSLRIPQSHDSGILSLGYCNYPKVHARYYDHRDLHRVRQNRHQNLIHCCDHRRIQCLLRIQLRGCQLVLPHGRHCGHRCNYLQYAHLQRQRHDLRQNHCHDYHQIHHHVHLPDYKYLHGLLHVPLLSHILLHNHLQGHLHVLLPDYGHLHVHLRNHGRLLDYLHGHHCGHLHGHLQDHNHQLNQGHLLYHDCHGLLPGHVHRVHLCRDLRRIHRLRSFHDLLRNHDHRQNHLHSLLRGHHHDCYLRDHCL